VPLPLTSGARFIGSNFVRDIVNPTDHHVTVIDSDTYAGTRASLAGVGPDRLAFVQGDIGDAELVDHLVGDADAVVHSAHKPTTITRSMTWAHSSRPTPSVPMGC
jgi:dTDP-glucose 4,6-dehydratase